MRALLILSILAVLPACAQSSELSGKYCLGDGNSNEHIVFTGEHTARFVSNYGTRELTYVKEGNLVTLNSNNFGSMQVALVDGPSADGNVMYACKY